MYIRCVGGKCTACPLISLSPTCMQVIRKRLAVDTNYTESLTGTSPLQHKEATSIICNAETMLMNSNGTSSPSRYI